ncbi:MAG: sodium:proton antiporter NhaD, partial [Puniceicoccales bacterium]|nr:sodium:proton antiporter NhaD [Puniceicoccales bacterium]
IFVLGYACIALEHPLKINKTATALFLAVALWFILATGGASFDAPAAAYKAFLAEWKPEVAGAAPPTFIAWLTEVPLIRQLGDVSQILFYLLGAMTVVELVDAHGGFRLITDRIRTRKKVALLWLVGFITFFMSAVLDNLTTAIVLVALLRKLIADRKERWFFASIVILAANAGGAWSPIGDVTTIMLWVANKYTSADIIARTIAASTVSLVVPLGVLSFLLKGEVARPAETDANAAGGGAAGAGANSHAAGAKEITPAQRNLVFALGVGALLFVPVFKALTHLPPWLGIMAGVSVLWVATGIMHRQRVDGTVAGDDSNRYTLAAALNRIDTPSILFFLGILMAVNALATGGHLALLSQTLDQLPLADPGKYYLITTLIGVLSSIVDNVPLVAGAMGMYSAQFAGGHWFWEFLAYAAGTGGSILIIGSAAGVAVMGLERIDFLWYLRKISWLALLGYLAGAATYIAQQALLGG